MIGLLVFWASAAIAGWGYSVIGNVFLLLLTAWLMAGGATSLLKDIRISSVLAGGNVPVPRSGRKTALPEYNLVWLAVGIGSLVAYFVIQSHWVLLAHGLLATLVALGGLWRWYSSKAW